MLAAFDSDGDGKLGLVELLDARAAVRSKLEHKWSELKQEFDSDGDGKLDADEAAALREDLKAHVRGEYFGK